MQTGGRPKRGYNIFTVPQASYFVDSLNKNHVACQKESLEDIKNTNVGNGATFKQHTSRMGIINGNFSK